MSKVFSKLPISVTIIACNEEDRIRQAISSVSPLSDDIIVVDSGSQDKTKELAQTLGARVYHNDWPGYGPQKRFAEKLAKHKWILNIDADEELTPELIEEIRYKFSTLNPQVIYNISFRFVPILADNPNFFIGEITAPRLYFTDYAEFRDSKVHDSVIPKNNNITYQKLENYARHYSMRSVSHAISKMNGYTDLQIEVMLSKKQKMSKLRIITEPLTSFLKAYFLKGYFRYGMRGYFETMLYVISRSIRSLKNYEAYHKKISTGNNDSGRPSK